MDPLLILVLVVVVIMYILFAAIGPFVFAVFAVVLLAAALVGFWVIPLFLVLSVLLIAWMLVWELIAPVVRWSAHIETREDIKKRLVLAAEESVRLRSLSAGHSYAAYQRSAEDIAALGKVLQALPADHCVFSAFSASSLGRDLDDLQIEKIEGLLRLHPAPGGAKLAGIGSLGFALGRLVRRMRSRRAT